MISTLKEYQIALARLEEIFFAKHGTPEGEEADNLANEILRYEEEHFGWSNEES